MRQSRTRLRAMGIVNALGASKAEVWEGLLSGRTDGLRPRAGLVPGRELMVGAVSAPLRRLPESLSSVSSRTAELLVEAFSQIEEEVARVAESAGRARVGVVLGSSTSGIPEGERAIREWKRSGTMPAGYRYSRQEMGSVASVISLYAGLGGPAYTVSTACSSSAKVFRSAELLIESGACDAVVAGGADCLCGLTLNGFSSLELISEGLANPFSRNRSGINIGEGACLFLLTGEEGGIQLAGVGESSDAHHISAPDPEARGAVRALREALARGGIEPAQVDYVNLHGTATTHNDAMEAKAIAAVFPAGVPCSSTKPMVGHMLGASGATEVGVCWLALDDYLRRADGELSLPPHRYDGQYDESLPPLSLVRPGESLRPSGRAVCLSNSFGFGGSNCAVAISASLGGRS